jgi:hypothetical protein
MSVRWWAGCRSVMAGLLPGMWGDRALGRTRRLLNRASWDTCVAMGVVRRLAVEGLDEAARRAGRRRGLAIGVLDERGQEKAGAATAGVQRPYLGCAGKVASGINPCIWRMCASMPGRR